MVLFTWELTRLLCSALLEVVRHALFAYYYHLIQTNLMMTHLHKAVLHLWRDLSL